MMTFKRSVLSQTGISMVGTMVGVGMLGALALGATKLIENMRKGQVSSETRMEGLELKRSIVSALSNKDHCRASLGGARLGETLPNLKYASGVPFVEVDKVYGQNRVKVTKIETINKGDIGGGTNAVDLSVSVEKVSKDAMTPPRPIVVPLIVKTGLGIIDSCLVEEDNTLKNACESLGGTFTSGSCQLPKCANGEALRGINPDGTAECFIPLANTSCPSGSVMTGLNQTGNPICIVNNPTTPPPLDPTGGSGGTSGGSTTGDPPPSGPTCASTTLGNWNVQGNSAICSGSGQQLPVGQVGQVVQVVDSTGPEKGSISARCSETGWVGVPESARCTAEYRCYYQTYIYMNYDSRCEQGVDSYSGGERTVSSEAECLAVCDSQCVGDAGFPGAWFHVKMNCRIMN